MAFSMWSVSRPDLPFPVPSSALCFTCVWYSVIITGSMAYIFLIQLINISYNVTEREVQQALRQKTGRRLLCGLIVDTGQYNRGFLRNWHQFSTLGVHPFHHPAEDIVWSAFCMAPGVRGWLLPLLPCVGHFGTHRMLMFIPWFLQAL